MICKYRKFEYTKELNEEDIWKIFQLDQEYGRFKEEKRQMTDFLTSLLPYDKDME